MDVFDVHFTSGASSHHLYTIPAMKKQSLMERLRAKKQARSSVVGVTWYTEENWSRVRAAATDPERFEDMYAEWNAMAVEAVAGLKRTGVNTVKFFINADELLSWCLRHNKPNNAESRTEFVSEGLRVQSETGASLKKHLLTD